MELLVTGYAGLDCSREIYLNEETRKKLLDHYPQSFFVVLEKEQPEGNVSAGCSGIVDSESAAEGGVLGALWRLLKRNRLGARFDQRRIPVMQQTIEICETFGLDPYRMASEGCRVYLAEDAGALSDASKKAGVICRQIGFTEKGPAIRRIDGAAVAYLRKS